MKDYDKNNKKIIKLKIAVVYPNYGLTGGAENFVFELTERLAENDNFEIHVFANKWRKGKSPVIFHKIPIIKFPRWAKPVSFAWFTQKAIKSGNFHIVHSHERIYKYDFLSHHGIPHKTWIKEIRKKRPSLFDRAVISIEKAGITNLKCPQILPVSNLCREHLVKEFNLSDSRVTIVHPGITVKKFTEVNHNECRKEIRNFHKIADDDIVILFAGLNFDVKGLDRLLESIADFTEAGKKYPLLKLLIIGKGNEKKYSNMAENLKIRDRVIFAGIKHNVEKYYHAADLFSILSYRESFGIVILEAMACGLPVIISETVGAKDVVKQDITGYIIKNTNLKKEMSNALFALMNKEKREEMGENAKSIIANYDWDIVAKRVAAIYMQRYKDSQSYCFLHQKDV